MKALKTLVVLGAFAAATAQAAPITIDFDDLGNNVVVGAAYAGLGVTFTDAETAPFGVLPGGTSPRAILHDTLFSAFGPSNPIVAAFASAVTSVSLTALDVGAAGFLFRAYDAIVGGSVVDSDSFTGVGIGVGDFATLTLTGSGIRRVEFSQITAGAQGDGVAFDNLVFDTRGAVPEPTTSALLMLGLLGAGFAARRKR